MKIVALSCVFIFINWLSLWSPYTPNMKTYPYRISMLTYTYLF